MHIRFMLGRAPYLAATLFLTACSGNDQVTTASDDSNANIASASNALTVSNVVVSGPGRVSATVHHDATLTLNTRSEGCRNSPGPFITIDGSLKLGGIDANIIFRNNAKGTHETDPVEAKLVTLITPENGSIVLSKNKHGSGEALGGNPLVALQLEDNHGHRIGDIINLGRCNKLKASTTVITKILSELDMGLRTGNCSNQGSTIEITGALAVGGVNGKLLFYKNPAREQPSAVADVSVAVTILPDKLPVYIPKQPPLGGAGGNPLVCVDLPANSGYDPVCLGRCKQL